mgnify:CR=1 FL=1
MTFPALSNSERTGHGLASARPADSAGRVPAGETRCAVIDTFPSDATNPREALSGPQSRWEDR